MENNDVYKDPERLIQELEKTKSQFYIFYELTQAMRTTLRLDEIAYIILTGLTAHQGLGFNRAILFLIDEIKKVIKGFMGLGPMDIEEANKIWGLIEEQKMDLYALIEAYRRIKEGEIQPKLMQFTRSLEFPLKESSGLIYEALYEVVPIYIKNHLADQYKNDPLIHRLNLKDFIIAPLWSKNNPMGIIIVDNYITKKPITDEDLRILTMFINQASGAIENSKTYEDTLMRAHTDTLTSLWNYGYFQYKLDEEIMKARSDNRKISVLMVDIDNFKKFNDTFGHQAGDEALKNIATNIQRSARKIDIACRYGGEEFSFILPDTSKEEATTIAERMRTTISNTAIMNYTFTISIGIASFPEDAQNKEELIRKSDWALYKAKNEGKNKVVTIQ